MLSVSGQVCWQLVNPVRRGRWLELAAYPSGFVSIVYRFPNFSAVVPHLATLQRGLLLAMLGVFYLVLWQGPSTWVGKTLFMAHLGLFMLWQPFVHSGQRLSMRSLLGVTVVVGVTTWALTWWLLAVWVMMMAGVVGGKVLLFGTRSARLFYLMALGFLVTALLLQVAPAAVPSAQVPPQILWLGYAGLPLTLVVMCLLPRSVEQDGTGEVVDFVYSLFVFLLLAVLMLGSLAAMLIFGSGYVEAVLQSLFLMSLVLLVLGWVWNPHAGFSGLGNLFSRYLMSIGLPVEQWLQSLAECALREEDPERFLEQSCTEMARRLPWVTGGEWVAGEHQGTFGLPGEHRSEFAHGSLVLVLFTRQTLSPTLLWHFNLMAQLLAEFHADKLRAQALKELSYLRAIHETGARLTHDVKNLLQSLNALCAAISEPGAASSPAYHALLQRQLPVISSRLSETLNKLKSPQDSQDTTDMAAVPAEIWWQELKQRSLMNDWILFDDTTATGAVPAGVFTGVVDNLIRNASEKRLQEPALHLRLRLESGRQGAELTVRDDGSAIPQAMADNLFSRPVQSENGLGIGLYQAARHAEAAGYRLTLAENRPGCVCFQLTAA